MEITNARLILPDAIERGSLSINNGRIQEISKDATPAAKSKGERMDLRGGFLAPGFVDLHIHGALGRDTMEARLDAFREITDFHLKGGTTSLTLTTLSASQQDILNTLDAIAPIHNQSLGGSRIIGVHVEGPFINKARAGAQNPDYCRNPSAKEWGPILKYGTLITQMTLAHELPRANVLIKALRKNGSIASAGHTDATEKDLFPALKAGLNQSTHTFNAMSGLVKKGPYRMAGMLEFALAYHDISCELIADGQHVPPVLMRMLFNAKPRDQVVIITDATKGAGLKPSTLPLPDHYDFADSPFTDSHAEVILITEKDAVKCGHLDDPRIWVVPTTPVVDPALVEQVCQRVRALADRATLKASAQ